MSVSQTDKCWQVSYNGRWFFWFFIVSADMEMRYIIMELKTCPLPWILWYEPKVSVSVSMNRTAGSNVRPGHKFGFPAGAILTMGRPFCLFRIYVANVRRFSIRKMFINAWRQGFMERREELFCGPNFAEANRVCHRPQLQQILFPSSIIISPPFVNTKNDTHLSTSLQNIW